MNLALFFIGLAMVAYPLIEVLIKHGPSEDSPERWLMNQPLERLERIQSLGVVGLIFIALSVAWTIPR